MVAPILLIPILFITSCINTYQIHKHVFLLFVYIYIISNIFLRIFHLAHSHACHATCSVSMILLNKTIAMSFDYPWTVLLIQNLGTVGLGYLYPAYKRMVGMVDENDKKAEGDNRAKVGYFSWSDRCDLIIKESRIFGVPYPKQLKNKLWVANQVWQFMATLYISFRALKYMSVPFYVVARNMVPAVTYWLERCVLGTQISKERLSGLLCTVIGAATYTYAGKPASSTNLSTTIEQEESSGFSEYMVSILYGLMLIGIVALISVTDRTAVGKLKAEEDMQPVECNQLRVLVSLPFNLLFVFAMDGANMSTDLGNISTTIFWCLFFSTVFGFGMGTFNFYLQQATSATTVQVANIMYKLTTTLISLVTHPAVVTMLGWGGYAISLMGIGLYTFGPKEEAVADKVPLREPVGKEMVDLEEGELTTTPGSEVGRKPVE